MVKVPKEVFDGLEYVRASGRTNMFAYKTVIDFAEEAGYDETVAWLEENKDTYMEGIIEGIEPE